MGELDQTAFSPGMVEMMLQGARKVEPSAFNVVGKCKEGGCCLMISFLEWTADASVRAAGGYSYVTLIFTFVSRFECYYGSNDVIKENLANFDERCSRIQFEPSPLCAGNFESSYNIKHFLFFLPPTPNVPSNPSF